MNKVRLKRTVHRNAPSILTGMGIAGMWIMGVMIFKAAPVVKQKLDEAEEKKEDKLTVVEKGKIALPIMWPSLAVGAISTYSSISANKVHLRRNAALSSACYISQRKLREYQDKVIETFGENKERKVRESVAKQQMIDHPVTKNKVHETGLGTSLCYLVPFGIYFRSDYQKVQQAIINVNERLFNGNEWYITVNEILDELHIRHIGVGDDLGWPSEKGQFVVEYDSELADDGTPCLIMDFDVVQV